MTIRDLHNLAIALGMGRDVHERLHDAAVAAFGVGSLTECTDDQLEQLADTVRSWFSPPRAIADPNRCHRPFYRPNCRRPRRGRPSEPGVAKMITVPQQELLAKLANQVFLGNRTYYSNFLQTEPSLRPYRLTEPDQIITSPVACRVIQALIRRAKEQKYPSGRGARGSGCRDRGAEPQAQARGRSSPPPDPQPQTPIPWPEPKHPTPAEFYKDHLQHPSSSLPSLPSVQSNPSRLCASAFQKDSQRKAAKSQSETSTPSNQSESQSRRIRDIYLTPPSTIGR